MRLVNNEKYFLKYTSRPIYITHKIFGKDYAAIHEVKPVLILEKPIYVGFTVLDMSKWKMDGFHYNFIKKNYNAELLIIDTDNLVYEIKSENVSEEFFKWKDLFDLSNHSKDSNFFNETNKRVIGNRKDEFGGVIVSEFVALKSKMYSIKKIDGKGYDTVKRGAMQLSLINSKMFYLIKKLLKMKRKMKKMKKNEKNSK